MISQSFETIFVPVPDFSRGSTPFNAREISPISSVDSGFSLGVATR